MIVHLPGRAFKIEQLAPATAVIEELFTDNLWIVVVGEEPIDLASLPSPIKEPA
jgi:hypothetical protein